MSADNVVPFGRPGMTIGGLIEEAGASLNIYGDDLDPDEITRLLGLAPTHSHRLGDRLKPHSPPFRTGCWTHRVEGAGPGDPADLALGSLLDRLPSEASFWAPLGQRYQIRIFFCIGFKGWNKAFTLSAGNVQRVARLGVRLDFDLYADDQTPSELLEILDRGPGGSGGTNRRSR